MSEQTDMLEVEPVRLKLTRYADILQVGKLFGAATVVEALSSVKEDRRGPGFGYAVAIAERELADLRTGLYGSNLRRLAKAGVNISRVKAVSMDGDEIVASFYADGEGED